MATANISLTYNFSTLEGKIDAETSRQGAFLRYENGESAYDDLKVHTNDQPTIDEYIHDAIASVEKQFSDELVSKTETGGVCTLGLYLPDCPTAAASAATDELVRFIVLSVTARWLERRSFVNYSKAVMANADSSFQNAVRLLRTRNYLSSEN